VKLLFIGGTGIISSACVRLALARGMEVTLYCRGETGRHAIPRGPHGAEVLHGDIRDVAATRAALEGRSFDSVLQFIGFLPEHVASDIETFRGKVGQYVFISSASAYQTPPARLPVTESTPLENPYWQYSRDKIACEARLFEAHEDLGFPLTVVRPSHTYDLPLLPMHGGWTVVDRMRRGLPVIVHDDGTTLWTLTHHEDFAVGLVGLLGQSRAIGEAFHITSDETLTWDQIHELIARAAGAEAKVVHVPSERIAALDAAWGASLLGDKAHSMVFDNSKIRSLVPDFRPAIPYRTGAERQIAWYDEDPRRRVVSGDVNAMIDRILAAAAS
jgi:nucleoside-diphosphate-sugar epimerase